MMCCYYICLLVLQTEFMYTCYEELEGCCPLRCGALILPITLPSGNDLFQGQVFFTLFLLLLVLLWPRSRAFISLYPYHFLSRLSYNSSPKKEAEGPFEMLVSIWQTTCRHVPKDRDHNYNTHWNSLRLFFLCVSLNCNINIFFSNKILGLNYIFISCNVQMLCMMSRDLLGYNAVYCVDFQQSTWLILYRYWPKRHFSSNFQSKTPNIKFHSII
jgi:hypothetical protein